MCECADYIVYTVLFVSPTSGILLQDVASQNFCSNPCKQSWRNSSPWWTFLYLWWGSWYFLHSCFFVSICVSPSLMTAAATQVKSVYCLKTQLCVFKLNFAKYRFTPTVKSMLCEKFKTEILTMAVVKIPFEHACLWYGSSKWSFLMDRWAKEAQGCWDSNCVTPTIHFQLDQDRAAGHHQNLDRRAPPIQFQLDEVRSQSFHQQSSAIQHLPEIDSVPFAPVEDKPEDDQIGLSLTFESSEPKASVVSPQLNDAAKIKHKRECRTEVGEEKCEISSKHWRYEHSFSGTVFSYWLLSKVKL